MDGRLLAMAGLVALTATVALAQQRGGTPRTDAVTPVNDGPNPYTVIRDWAQLTIEQRPWGGSNGVDIDRDGKTVWATDRCSPGTPPVASAAPPTQSTTSTNRAARSELRWRHVRLAARHPRRSRRQHLGHRRGAPRAEDLASWPGEARKGSVVVKFSPDGRVLMTIGKPGVHGNPPEALTDPTDVVTDPATGDVYIAESHTDVAAPGLIGRISVFDSSGRFLRRSARPAPAPESSARRTRSSSTRRAAWSSPIATTTGFRSSRRPERRSPSSMTSADQRPGDRPATCSIRPTPSRPSASIPAGARASASARSRTAR